MNKENNIFHMPFDESDGSEIAYDYSKSRADGVVKGAHFVPGKNGNAISFSGDATCEVSQELFLTLKGNFTILAWVQVETPNLSWFLNFDEADNTVEFDFDVVPGMWTSIALVKRGLTYNVYVNSNLIGSIRNAGKLIGFSLNQNDETTENGVSLLDDVKIFDVALSVDDINKEINNIKDISYLIDGIDFKNWGVFVSGSDGILSKPKLKAPKSVSWDDYHGKSVDLMHKFYDVRKITLSCFIKAPSKIDFITQLSNFEQQFDKQGTQRLMIDVHPIKPLIYEVYCEDEIDPTKQWDDKEMVGTFKLKLVEPEPVKRVLKFNRFDESTKQCTITLTSQKYVNIYWGDGTADYDVNGTQRTITHDYATDGAYFPVITGCIDEITNFETNAIVVWSKI